MAAHAGHLLVEVAPGEQARELEHASQLHLAPRTADRRGVECCGQGRRLGAQRLRRPADLGEALAELAELLRPVALEGADLALDAADGVAQRAEEGGRLRIVDAGGLEVADPLAQHVALGLGGRGAREQAGADPQPADRRTESGADDQPDDEPDEQPDERRGHVHAATVADPTDTGPSTRPHGAREAGVSVVPGADGVAAPRVC